MCWQNRLYKEYTSNPIPTCASSFLTTHCYLSSLISVEQKNALREEGCYTHEKCRDGVLVLSLYILSGLHTAIPIPPVWWYMALPFLHPSTNVVYTCGLRNEAGMVQIIQISGGKPSKLANTHVLSTCMYSGVSPPNITSPYLKSIFRKQLNSSFLIRVLEQLFKCSTYMPHQHWHHYT